MKQQHILLALLATLMLWFAVTETHSVENHNITASSGIENFVPPATVATPDNIITSGVATFSFGQIVINISSCFKEKIQLYKLLFEKYIKNGRLLYNQPFTKSRNAALHSRIFLKAIILNCTLLI
jgi:hypothetical protein